LKKKKKKKKKKKVKNRHGFVFSVSQRVHLSKSLAVVGAISAFFHMSAAAAVAAAAATTAPTSLPSAGVQVQQTTIVRELSKEPVGLDKVKGCDRDAVIAVAIQMASIHKDKSDPMWEQEIQQVGSLYRVLGLGFRQDVTRDDLDKIKAAHPHCIDVVVNFAIQPKACAQSGAVVALVVSEEHARRNLQLVIEPTTPMTPRSSNSNSEAITPNGGSDMPVDNAAYHRTKRQRSDSTAGEHVTIASVPVDADTVVGGNAANNNNLAMPVAATVGGPSSSTSWFRTLLPF
jgi:hypothetical protein